MKMNLQTMTTIQIPIKTKPTPRPKMRSTTQMKNSIANFASDMGSQSIL